VGLLAVFGLAAYLYARYISHLTDKQLLIGYCLLVVTLIFAITLLVFQPLLKHLAHAQQQLKQQQTLDNLTRLPHRQAFQLIAKQALALSQRYQWSLSAIRIDIDHFQSINQSYGQLLGDKVIQHIANTLKAQCRESDSIFRYEGQEFVILLPQTKQQDALTLAQKIIDKVANNPFSTDKLIIELTASCGVSEWQAKETDLEPCLERSAKALTEAKKQGRNRVA
jgi:diguanylate cyclase (GGDEF)-like protein